MRNELLKHGDYNVIIVDWAGGSLPLYTQATANTRLVGLEIAHLIKHLEVKTSSLFLIAPGITYPRMRDKCVAP